MSARRWGRADDAQRPAGAPRTRLLAVTSACLALAAGVALGACGGSSVSDHVPKSTPDITPPNDTSAEKAAGQTTSTSTSSKSKTSTSGTGEGSTTGEGGTEAEGGKEGSGESGGTGGAPAEKEKSAEGGSKGGGQAAEGAKEGSGSPTGGASAP